MAEDTHLNRRGFLSIVITAIGGLITAGLAIPAVAYIIGPALRSDKVGQWIRL